jgi:hypothetical protein
MAVRRVVAETGAAIGREGWGERRPSSSPHRRRRGDAPEVRQLRRKTRYPWRCVRLHHRQFSAAGLHLRIEPRRDDLVRRQPSRIGAEARIDATMPRLSTICLSFVPTGPSPSALRCPGWRPGPC